MTSCDDFIEKAKKELPDLCSTKDLVKLGIFKSEQAAWDSRKKGTSFDYFKLPYGTIVYPKKGIIETLEKSKYDNSGEKDENNDSRKSYTESKSTSHKKGLRL